MKPSFSHFSLFMPQVKMNEEGNEQYIYCLFTKNIIQKAHATTAAHCLSFILLSTFFHLFFFCCFCASAFSPSSLASVKKVEFSFVRESRYGEGRRVIPYDLTNHHEQDKI